MVPNNAQAVPGRRYINNAMQCLLKWAACAMMCLTAPTAGAAQQPLFAAAETIYVRIEGPVSAIVSKGARSSAPSPALLSLAGEARGSGEAFGGGPDQAQSPGTKITLAARGKSRRTRGICTFPPLRVRFDKKPKSGLFKGQKSLKLVTHCHRSERRDHYVLLEYGAYQMLQAITPQAMRVRLAKISYFDSTKGKDLGERYGFFIEDMDAAAKRNDMKELNVARASNQQLDAQAAARITLFHYMIGNLDWSMNAGPQGSDCCHNMKLMAPKRKSTSGFVPVPYDFDMTGLVNPPKPLLPEGVRVHSIKQRLYRGTCGMNTAVAQQALLFSARKPDILSALQHVPDISDKEMTKALKYLDQFFQLAADPQKFDRTVLRKCRTKGP